MMMCEFAKWKAEQATEWLNHLRGLRLMAVAADAYMETAITIRGIDYTKPVVTTSVNVDAVPNAAERMSEYRDVYTDTLSTYSAERNDAAMRINSMQSSYLHKSILLCYYLSGYTWKETGDKLGYSAEYCREMRDDSLQYVYDVMPNEYKTQIPRADA